MKIAITSNGDSLDSKLDSRFGRCSYFAIHDTENNDTVFYANPNKESQEGAGPASAQFVVSKGVQMILSGEFGGKVKSLLESLQITMVALKDNQKTIKELLEEYPSNN